jgi:hypothetical protein
VTTEAREGDDKVEDRGRTEKEMGEIGASILVLASSRTEVRLSVRPAILLGHVSLLDFHLRIEM